MFFMPVTQFSNNGHAVDKQNQTTSTDKTSQETSGENTTANASSQTETKSVQQSGNSQNTKNTKSKDDSGVPTGSGNISGSYSDLESSVNEEQHIANAKKLAEKIQTELQFSWFFNADDGENTDLSSLSNGTSSAKDQSSEQLASIAYQQY